MSWQWCTIVTKLLSIVSRLKCKPRPLFTSSTASQRDAQPMPSGHIPFVLRASTRASPLQPPRVPQQFPRWRWGTFHCQPFPRASRHLSSSRLLLQREGTENLNGSSPGAVHYISVCSRGDRTDGKPLGVRCASPRPTSCPNHAAATRHGCASSDAIVP